MTIANDADSVKREVENFWNRHPCGSKFVDEVFGSREFFVKVEKERYNLEPHILQIILSQAIKGKKILEIGCGLGTDGTQFARKNGRYFAVDLAVRHIELSKKRFELFGLDGNFQIADAENLPFLDNTFDIVYSHGVLHHTPDTQKAMDEIYRILTPGGKAIVMLYHKNSYNYYFNIMFLRRIGIFLLCFPGGVEFVRRLTGEDSLRLLEHKRNLRLGGLKYLSAQRFLNQNTDGPGNPLSKVYTKKEVIKMFRNFRKVRMDIRYLNKRWIPLVGRYIPRSLEKTLEKLWGWHLYIFAEK